MADRHESIDFKEVARLGQSCPLGHLRRATRVMEHIFDETLRPSGLRGSQLAVLAVTALIGPTNISSLAERLVMDRTTLTRSLKPLEGQGLIKIATGEDRRTREVSLTARGERVMAQVMPLWESAQKLVIEELGNRWHRKLLENLSEVDSLASPGSSSMVSSNRTARAAEKKPSNG